MAMRREREIPNPKIAIFIIPDKYLNVLNDFSMDVIKRIVDKLKSSNIEIYFNDKVLKGQGEATKEAVKMLGNDLDSTYFISPHGLKVLQRFQ